MDLSSLNPVQVLSLALGSVSFIALVVLVRIRQYNKSVLKCIAIAEMAGKVGWAEDERTTYIHDPEAIPHPCDSIGAYLSSRCGIDVTLVENLKGKGTGWTRIKYTWKYRGYVSKHDVIHSHSSWTRLDTVGRILKKIHEANLAVKWDY